MGYKKQSELRRAENEVVFKEHNQRLQSRLARILPHENKGSFLVGFACECSDENCHEQINLTIQQFKTSSVNPRHFIVKPGHSQLDIEHIIGTFDGYNIVEKYEAPPSTDGHLNRTNTGNV